MTDYSYTTIGVPGATNTDAVAINNSGQVVGFYRIGAKDESFICSDGAFATIDVPGGIDTDAVSINNFGQVVGVYNDGVVYLQGFI
jgi:hypothetical protein